MGFLTGKRILITGLLSNRSIAYGIAQAMHREGAELAFTYQNDRILDRVAKLASDFGNPQLFVCDVAEDAQIDAVFTELAKHWDGFDILVHSVGFAPREALDGEFQAGLARRLAGAQDNRASALLAVQAGKRNWLVDLTEAGETASIVGQLTERTGEPVIFQGKLSL